MDEKKVKDIGNIKDTKDATREIETVKAEAEAISNERVFEVDKKSYRVRVPSPQEQREAGDYRARTIAKYLKDGEYLTKSEIDKVLEKRGIESLEKQLEPVKTKIKEQQVALAQTTDEEVDTLKEKEEGITKLLVELQNTAKDVAIHYQYSCENMAFVQEMLYLSYECSEIKDKDWKPVWNSFKEMKDDKSGLADRAMAEFSDFWMGRGAVNAPFGE